MGELRNYLEKKIRELNLVAAETNNRGAVAAAKRKGYKLERYASDLLLGLACGSPGDGMVFATNAGYSKTTLGMCALSLLYKRESAARKAEMYSRGGRRFSVAPVVVVGCAVKIADVENKLCATCGYGVAHHLVKMG